MLSDLMRFFSAVVLCLVLAQTAIGAIIDHDKVQPFAQPDPVTISEKTAVKFKPQLQITRSCVPFPAVNAAGDITGGLKPTKGRDACTEAPLGSQVYGRSTWYQDKWAMMFAWYFPKNFWFGTSTRRHLWANYVLWLDNPALETPKILGASLSRQTLKVPKVLFVPFGRQQTDPYMKETAIPPSAFVGSHNLRIQRGTNRQPDFLTMFVTGSNVSTWVSQSYPDDSNWIGLEFADEDGEYQDLIMWNQLTEQARAALESADFGGDTKVPFNDKNFEASLAQAWPF